MAVILDEVDLLSEKDKTKEILCIYLSRSPAGYMAVLLSNNPRWATTLDESIQSTLQPEAILSALYGRGTGDHIGTTANWDYAERTTVC